MNNSKRLPLIPLRGLTVFPHMILHFDVGRSKSVLAVNEAILNKQEILLVTQKEAQVEDPSEEDLYAIGTVCVIRQTLNLAGNTVRVLVEGLYRAKIKNLEQENSFLSAEALPLETLTQASPEELEALMRSVKQALYHYVKVSGAVPRETFGAMEDIRDAERYADMVLAFLPMSVADKQAFLEEPSLKKLLEKLLVFINNETEIVKLENKIGRKVKTNIDKSQREYYLREQLRAIQEELGEEDETKKEITRYHHRITEADLPKEAKERAFYELDRLKNSGPYSAEGGVIRTYIDWILDLPWRVYTQDSKDIKRSRQILDAEHYGLKDVKDRIVEYLAVKATKDSLKGPILCLVGPPGVGKTSIAKSVAHALDRNFVRMSLGGVRDEAEIRGHRRTYVGATPGRIIYGMRQAKSSNPLFLLDEVDKMAEDFRGDPADALLEVLDAEQNSTFRDHYLELEYDLSKVMFITTANSLDTIPWALLDRMEVIEVSGYTYEEKRNIAKRHLIPKELKEHGVDGRTLRITDEALSAIIDGYTRESGVRKLEQQIASCIRKAIARLLETHKKSITINPKVVEEFLGHPRFAYDKADQKDRVGVATGLAWTPFGGDILPIEVQVMDGGGKLELTGSLGDVMKESARAAYSYIRSRAKELGVPQDFHKNLDLHIHVPEGATPKDGPSAGITMATAMVSALSGTPVRSDVAMTGEITLTGRVLPIGGLREKSLAAYRAGIKTIIIPKKNEPDLDDIPESIRTEMTFLPASDISEVIPQALRGDA
ncbi:ATP-dependent protease La Type I [Clostridiaceae bacterium JG1575]|nr:ATP-dependent protease La Type I [Clostridiaceae bacterium JG1575]